MKLYNLATGLLFCLLAGSMITVSATAVGPFLPAGTIEMPTFQSTLPTGPAWVVSSVAIGAAMTLVALKGYGVVAQVGRYAAPWMFLVFVACALVTLGRLGTADLWALLTPPEGTPRTISFLGIVCFAWFCNAAMHIGMADLSVLRFAKRPSAGWTTANPTIDRAGLAFQAMIPGISRAAATLLAGGLCIAAGIFPAFAMNLLDFVGIYGTILAPVGGIIVVDTFLADRVGISRDPAARIGSAFNVSVLVAWLVPGAVAIWLYKSQGVFAPYLPLPCTIACGLLSILLSRLTAHEPQGAVTSGLAADRA